MSVLGSIIPGWKWISGTIGVLVIGLVAWLLIDWLVIGPRGLPGAEREALKVASQQVASDILKRLDESDRYTMNLAVVVQRDTNNGEAADVLVSTLKDNDRFALPGTGVLDEIKRSATGWLGSQASKGPEKLLEERAELDGVLVLDLERDSFSKVAKATLGGTLIERRRGEDRKVIPGYDRVGVEGTGSVLIATGEAVTGDGEEAAASSGGFLNGVGKFLLALILGAGIPFLWLPVTDRISEISKRQGNNVVGLVFFLIVVLTASLPYAFLFIVPPEGGEPAGAFAWIVGVCFMLGIGKWTYDMHSAWAERL